jgi:hypothetical protein
VTYPPHVQAAQWNRFHIDKDFVVILSQVAKAPLLESIDYFNAMLS